ncbi:ComF family protein [Hymenobacter koreensis]|uniref:ComF family protein n=1 Tax=Hymenobacter koreensis TaxID=1084523 RepID=A0ABP8JGU5_9BACT
MLRGALSDFIALAFPHTCLACLQPLARGETHLCTDCRAQLPYTDFHRLSPAANPLARLFWGRVPVEHVLSYLRFLRRGRVQHLLHQLKYKGQREVGSALGLMYGQELAEIGLGTDVQLIAPVPLHPRKLAKRGYNQSDSFAEGLAQSLELPWSPSTLQRTDYTASQTRMTRSQRWQNVADVFVVPNPTAVQGQHVLIVDDVLTTGATLEACAVKLLAAGAAKVNVATIAYAEH